MKLEVNIDKKYFFILLGVIIVLGISVGVYAVLGTTPNPGHAISELQKCSEGETLKIIGGVWICGGGFGALESKSQNTIYQATTDGIIVAYGQSSSYFKIKTDSSNPPVTIVIESEGTAVGAARPSATVPVKKNDYWKVEPVSGTIVVRWMPIN